ncbi:MAG: glycosyltransferase family 2 protein [Aeromicrobium sp.]
MFEEAEETSPWLANPPSVAAILVAHNGAAWLPKVFASLGVMDFAPGSWNVVDVSSTDGSGELLRETFGAERITYAPSGTGFGAAVQLGLNSAPTTDWIWLLHDDCAVMPGTLAGLLDEAMSSPDIAVVGPKVREWPSLRRLLEVGLTVTSTGGRETSLEPGEPDAGQHDRPCDVLAVNTAGVLIRRDVWDELKGFDPTLPLFFDDIDFGWRAARAGYRVRTAPRAIIFHAEASARGSRRATAGDVQTYELRRAAMFTLLANASSSKFLWQYVRLFFGTLLRVLGLLVVRAPEEAGDELQALRLIYLHPRALREARRRRASTARVSARSIRHLLPPPWLPYQHGLDSLRSAITAMVRPEQIETAGRRSSTLDDGPDESHDLTEDPSIFVRRPWLVTVLSFLVLSLIAGRGLFSGGLLHGGALLASPDTAGAWWRLAFERWHDVGIGSSTIAPAFALPLAATGSLVWFKPGMVVAALLLFAVPLAGLTAHRLGRQLCFDRPIRIVWAVTYALAILGTGAVSQGRLGTVVALVILPIIVNTMLQTMEKPGWQLGLRLGIWIAVATAFAPLLYLFALFGILIVAVAGNRTLRASMAVAAFLPVLLLGPWIIQRVLIPMRWWWEAGYASGYAASVRDIAFGRAGGPGAAPFWLSSGVLILGCLALIPKRTRREVSWAWIFALVGLGVAAAGAVSTYSTPSSQVAVNAWVGIPVVIWIGGLATAALLAADGLRTVARPAVVVLVILAMVLPLGTTGWWLFRGEQEPLTRGALSEVPAFLVTRPGSTLVVRGDIAEGITYDVVDADGLRLGQEAVIPPVSKSAGITSLVGRMLSSSSTSDLRELARFGVGAIYAPTVDPELARRLDAAPGLEPAGSEDPNSRVWTLPQKPAVAHGTGPIWHPILAGLQTLMWLLAIVLTAPVRQRRRIAEVES